MGRCICIIQKNGSNIFIHQRLTYKKREGGWVGGKDIKIIGQKRTEGEVEETPIFHLFYLIPPHSIHL
jgi:hypothetical protein